MTPDGRFVAYAATTSGYISSSPTGEVYVCDLVSNVTIWASTNAANIAKAVLNISSAACYHPAISDDGQYVAFKAGTRTGPAMIFQYSATNGSVIAISSNAVTLSQPVDDIYGPEMSPDGRFVVFITTNQSAACFTVQLWDAQAGTTRIVSDAWLGLPRPDDSLPTNSISDTPAVSADGRYVVFLSNVTNLAFNVVSNCFHIYCRDMQTGMTRLIDVASHNVGSANPLAAVPVMSSNGRDIAFECRGGGLADGDQNGMFNVYLRDQNTQTTELISPRDASLVPRTGDGLSFAVPSGLSADGRKILFTSLANDLAPNDANGSADVFVYDAQSGTNALVNVGMDGNSAAGISTNSVMSANGRFAAFVSTATNLVANNTNGAADLYLRDLEAGATTLVNVDSNGNKLGTNGAYSPVISQDGRYVAFLCKTNSSQPYPGTYWRDTIAGQTVLLTNGSSATRPSSMSADGQRVLFCCPTYGFCVWDAPARSNMVVATSSFYGTWPAVLSPSGDLYAYYAALALRFGKIGGTSISFNLANLLPTTNSSAWSVDGRFFTFVKGSAAVPNPSTNNVYLCDVQSGTVTLVSTNAAHSGSGNGDSDWPAISGDGRFVVYRSFAADLVAGNVNPPPNIYLYDRFTGSNTVLTTSSPALAWSLLNAKPAINGDGSVIVWQGLNLYLPASGQNRGLDVLAQTLPPWGAVDSDGDGIPDLWMTHYFGHPIGTADDLSRAPDDADGTGMSNLQKYLAGLDPTNSASVFRLQLQAQAPLTNSAMVSWPAVPGKSYQVQSKNDLSDAVWSDVPGAQVIGLNGSAAISAGSTNHFFRVTTH
jgi:Tol biopolymer transport system component